MIVNIDLHQNIYDQLFTEAESKGLTVEEIIKVILGEHISFSSHKRFIVPTLPPIPPIMDKFARLANLIMNQMSATGALKCPNCTMPLNSEALETGVCNTCGTKL